MALWEHRNEEGCGRCNEGVSEGVRGAAHTIITSRPVVEGSEGLLHVPLEVIRFDLNKPDTHAPPQIIPIKKVAITKEVMQ